MPDKYLRGSGRRQYPLLAQDLILLTLFLFIFITCNRNLFNFFIENVGSTIENHYFDISVSVLVHEL